MRNGWTVLVLGALAMLLPGCTRENPEFTSVFTDSSLVDAGAADMYIPPPLPDGPRPYDLPPVKQDKGIPAKPNGVDVLLVVDNTPGMTYAQIWLGRDMAQLLADLETLPGGANYRVGVVTSDLGIGNFATANCSKIGTWGRLQIPQGCAEPEKGVKYLEAKGNNLNVPIPADKAISCMTRVGEKGCGFERTLSAMRLALLGEAKGFLRKDAALAVILASNEDDCSSRNLSLYDPAFPGLGPLTSYRCFANGVVCKEGAPARKENVLTDCVPSGKWLHDISTRYVKFLQDLKPPGWFSTLVLSGPPQKYTEVGVQYYRGGKQYFVKPTCQNAYQSGEPGIRLRSFAASFKTMGHAADICNNSYKPALKALFASIKSAF